MDYVIFGNNVQYLRRQKRMTQRALSKELYVSDKTISKWESGLALPEVSTLVLIADYFNVGIDDLLRKPLKNDGYDEFVYIMDMSGSMHRLTDDVIGGFNQFIADQKKLDGTGYLTTVLFNSDVYRLYRSKEFSKVELLDHKIYKANGSTALYDAIGETLLPLLRTSNTKKTMVIIMSDGYENASKYFSKNKVKKMIEEAKQLNWEFVFAGANIDVNQVSDDLGIEKNRRMRFISDSKGTRKLYRDMSKMTSDYRTTGKVHMRGDKS